MTDHTEATSTTRQIAPLAIILGIPLIFAAVFFYTSPVVLETGGQQGIFKCGSPSSPNTAAKNVCDDPETVARNKAIYSGLSGVSMVGLGAFWLLRRQRDDDDWDDDDVDRPRRRRSDDIDLSADTRDRDMEPRERSEGLRGVDKRRDRDLDDGRDLDDDGRDEDAADTEPDDGRAARRRSGGRRSVLRDDDFADPAPRRRADDDWSSDGWR